MPEISEKIEERIGVVEPDVEVIAVERSGSTLRVFIDHPDGVSLGLCERVTGHLRDLLETWSIEVSSPGTDRPLTKPEHFRRFVGRRVRIRTAQPIEGQRSFTGLLAAADEAAVRIDPGEGPVTIPFERIRRSNLVPDYDSTNREVAR